jgi:GlpG protein
VWVRDEEQIVKATSELQDFLAAPGDAKYLVAHREAKARRDQLARREDDARRNYVDMSRRWDGRGIGPAHVTMALIVISIAVAFLTRLGGYFGENEAVVQTFGWLYFAEERILAGEVWRLVTPIFLHFSPLHLLFNMYMFYPFGMLVEGRRGPLRFGLMVLLIAALSNFGQYYFEGPSFGGMSGVLYGLFGYAWMKSRFDPQSDIYLHPNTVLILMIWFALCAVGVIQNVANWAHGVGLAVGVVIGLTPYLWRRTMRRLHS